MKTPTLNRSAALVLQIAIALIGIAALALLLWEPHVEGRNAKATVVEIYFKDPFLAYVYVGSIPFFVALFRAFGLLGHMRRTGASSQTTVEGLLAIKRCAWALIGFMAGAGVIILVAGDKDDRPAGVFMSFLFTGAASAVAIAAAVLARKLSTTLGLTHGSRT